MYIFPITVFNRFRRHDISYTMKFCRECNNILYPKEDKEQKILRYACRNCDYQVWVRLVQLGSFLPTLEKEIADNYCVHRNEVHHSVSEKTQILTDVASDPTLPRTKAVRCAKCQHREAVFFQATTRSEDGMALFFVCCNRNCGHRWRD
ncbi:DNA-directed RNA polymerases II, IV and V subunit 9A-like isoform X2 [Brassica rapa]|uniref:DNA-directed RNA polymerases II, IV and V subunit 9A-like isoform X2 n=1 Tax=Brassica campestris TaxID=3711 RepID=UPI00142E36E5|nr:DNA-directed RNA polymerases II, IV and V subunit 9A-like isoform X2 [Brassica rapa]